MKSFFRFFIVFFLFGQTICIAQQNSSDKIWNGVSLEEKTHFLSIRDSFKTYLYADKSKGKLFVDSLHHLAKNIGPIKELEALTNKGSYFYVISEFDSAKYYYDLVIKSDFVMANQKYSYLAKLSLSQLYMNEGNFQLAENLLNEIETSNYEAEDKLFSVFLYRSILGSHIKDKEMEVVNLIKADSIGTDDLQQRFNLYYNLGGVMFNTHDYKKAVFYYEKAVPLIDSLSLFAYSPVIHNLIATGSEKIDSLKKMKINIDKALSQVDWAPREKGVSYYYLGTYYLRQKDFEEAQKMNNIALNEFREHDYRFYLLLAINQAIFIKNKLNDESSSKDLIDEAYAKCSAFFSEHDSLIFEEYRIRDKLRRTLNENDYQQMVVFFDSKTVFEENRTNDKVAELLKKYELNKKEMEIRLFEEKNRLAKSKIQRRNVIIVSLVTISITLLAFIFGIERILRKEKLISKILLEKKDQLLHSNQELVTQVNKKSRNRQGEILGQSLILTNKEGTKLSLQDIVYLESRNKAVSIILADGQEFREWQTLKSFRQLLPPRDFIQIHRSFIVNLSHIQERKGRILRMTNNIRLITSKSFFEKVAAKIDE